MGLPGLTKDYLRIVLGGQVFLTLLVQLLTLLVQPGLTKDYLCIVLGGQVLLYWYNSLLTLLVQPGLTKDYLRIVLGICSVYACMRLRMHACACVCADMHPSAQ
jgi:hypothetical protein